MTTPERWQALTPSVCLAAVVLLGLYNVAARRYGGEDATISACVTAAARRWPEVSFFAGLLAGHWFWSQRG